MEAAIVIIVGAALFFNSSKDNFFSKDTRVDATDSLKSENKIQHSCENEIKINRLFSFCLSKPDTNG